jgi:hypothetical protein
MTKFRIFYNLGLNPFVIKTHWPDRAPKLLIPLNKSGWAAENQDRF